MGKMIPAASGTTPGARPALPAAAAVLAALFAIMPAGLSQVLKKRASKADSEAPPAPETLHPRYRLGDIDAYIAERLHHLAILSRTTGPFGLPQDLSKKPTIQKPSHSSQKRFKPTPKIPLSQIVAALPVNAVMPGKQRFLVGSRSIRTGETFPIQYRGKRVTVRVLHIGLKSIDFVNAESGEKATLSLESLPPGLVRERNGNSPPGLERDTPGAPIEIQLPPASSRGNRRPVPGTGHPANHR